MKQQFKHNDRVQCLILDTEITDARISINSNGTPFICQNEENGADAENKLGYKYSWVMDKDFTGIDLSNLRLVEKTPAEELHEAILTCEQAGYTVKMNNSTTSTQHTPECIKKVEHYTKMAEDNTEQAEHHTKRAEVSTKRAKECTCKVTK